MKESMDTDPMTPFGMALLAFHEGREEAGVTVRRDDGVESFLPSKYFFRGPAELSAIESVATGLCRGHVLDIGAGSGLHSLLLQSRNIPVTAIDISLELTNLMISRGVKDVRQADIFTYNGGPFDTLLMLGHGIGITGDMAGLDRFLAHARNLIRTEGQLLLDSMDVGKTDDGKNLAYHEANRNAGRYIGEIRFRMIFQEITGKICKWLHIDPLTLAEHAGRAGWACEIILEQENGEYLARLHP